MQMHVNLVDLVKSFPTNILLQNLASIQKRTSPIKFAHFAEKSENGSISNLSTKVRGAGAPRLRGAGHAARADGSAAGRRAFVGHALRGPPRGGPRGRARPGNSLSFRSGNGFAAFHTPGSLLPPRRREPEVYYGPIAERLSRAGVSTP